MQSTTLVKQNFMVKYIMAPIKDCLEIYVAKLSTNQPDETDVINSIENCGIVNIFQGLFVLVGVAVLIYCNIP